MEKKEKKENKLTQSLRISGCLRGLYHASVDDGAECYHVIMLAVDEREAKEIALKAYNNEVPEEEFGSSLDIGITELNLNLNDSYLWL